MRRLWAAFIFGAGALAAAADVPVAAPCIAVRVGGCGRKARVCVQTTSPEQAQERALEAFRARHKCAAAAVSGWSGSCAEFDDAPCDLRR